MSEATDRPFHILATLEGKDNFFDGFDTKDHADIKLADITKRAKEMKLETTYKVVEGAYA